MALEIQLVPCLKDNYAYLLHDAASGETAAVDPSEAEPVTKAAAARGWRLTHILNTHHHWDHTGGNLALKEATGASIVGPAPTATAFPASTSRSTRMIASASATAPRWCCHPRPHPRPHRLPFADDQAVFCGDTLFALGCGRMFEGTRRRCGRRCASCGRCPGRPGSIAAMNTPRPMPASR